jgi:hypothetical protein
MQGIKFLRTLLAAPLVLTMGPSGNETLSVTPPLGATNAVKATAAAHAAKAAGTHLLGLHGLILCSFGKHRPGNASMLRRQRHSGHVDMPSLLQASRPRGFLIGLFADNPQISTRSVHEERP